MPKVEITSSTGPIVELQQKLAEVRDKMRSRLADGDTEPADLWRKEDLLVTAIAEAEASTVSEIQAKADVLAQLLRRQFSRVQWEGQSENLPPFALLGRALCSDMVRLDDIGPMLIELQADAAIFSSALRDEVGPARWEGPSTSLPHFAQVGRSLCFDLARLMTCPPQPSPAVTAWVS